MPTNKNTIEIDVKLREQVEKAQQQFAKSKEWKAFPDTAQGRDAEKKIQSAIDYLNDIVNTATSLDADQLKDVVKQFKIIFDTIKTYASRGVDPGLVDLISKQDEFSKQYKEATDELNKLKQTQAVAISSQVKDFLQQPGISVRKLKKDNTLSKTEIRSPQVMLENLTSGKAKVSLNDNINEAKTQELLSILQGYNKPTNEMSELTNKIKKLAANIDEYSTLIAKKEQELEQEGKTTDSQLYTETHSLALENTKLTGSLKQQLVNKDIKETKQETIALTNSINKQQSVLNKAFKAFSLYAIVIRSAKIAIQEAKNTIVELDKYLTEQAMVTGKTREETYALIDSYQELALQTGATTKEVASVATEYMKQGKTIQDSLTLTEAAISAAKVARVSVGDSVNYLTTALNGFQLSAEDAMSVSDKFAAVAASSATDYDELAIALSKVASQANLAGMSIDYTTALLTKGLETTREAPETMGTALKTIIARMRELSDYGETLEGDTDINNVESQLAYVGIALRNANGELRSTEDVLDELGRKWDTLNTNQQAAVAKALAGTRQQSRLIAMMSDYERVIELQQISERSAGATSAQAGVYLQGIEASLNNIRVSYEKIITNLSNNKVITDLLDTVAWLVELASNFVDSWAGVVIVIAALGTAISGIISKKIIENDLAKKNLELQRLQQIEALKKQQEEKVELAMKQAGIDAEDALYSGIKSRLYLEKAVTKQIAEQNRVKASGDTSTKNVTSKLENEAAKEQLKAQQAEQEAIESKTKAVSDLLEKDQEYAAIQKTINYLTTEGSNTLNWNINLMAIQTVVTNLVTAAKKLHTLFQKKDTAATKADTAATKKNTAAKIANKIATGALIAVALAAIAVLVVAIVKTIQSTNTLNEQIADLANEIYTLKSTTNEIDELTSSFDKLDQKVFKTKEDLEEMKDIAASLSEAVDFTWGGTKSDKEAEEEKSLFESMTYTDQIAYAKKNKEALQNIINQKNKQQLALFRTASNQNTLLSDSKVQSALRAANITELQQWIDSVEGYTEAELSAIESMGTELIQNLNKTQLGNLSNNAGGVKKLAESLAQIGQTTIDGELVNVLDILTSDDYALNDKVEAFNTISQTLSGDAKDAFNELYQEYLTFSELSDEVLTLIDNLNLSTSEINDFMEVVDELGGDVDDTLTSLTDFLTTFEKTDNLEFAIQNAFSGVLEQFEYGSEEYIAAYNKLVNAFEQSAGLGVQNIAQNLTSLENQISDFYEKALKWNEMTRTEQQDFIASNAEIFQEDADLLSAVQTGNFALIKNALQNNETLSNKIASQLQDVQTQLAIERSRQGNSYNATYVQWLEEQEAYLLNSQELYSISYEELLSLQEEQLNEYKSFLQDQQDALTESLDKRKEAYEKYFDAINEQKEDEDFDEQVDLLTANLAKLGASTNASAQQQRAEIESQLKDLEEERIQTLRERAQDAILENLDDEVSEINEKFSKLLDNNQMLLAAMTSDIQDPLKFATDLLTNKLNSGATALEMQDYAASLQGMFGSLFSGLDLSNIIASGDTNNSNNVVLNIGGDEITLNSQESDTVWAAIYAALQQIGKR